MTWLVTGGAGFIGSALCHYLAREADQKIVVVDKLTYAGNRASIESLEIEGRLDLIEAEWSALEAARRNVTDPRARLIWDDATTHTPDRRYDAILSNPPFHTCLLYTSDAADE